MEQLGTNKTSQGLEDLAKAPAPLCSMERRLGVARRPRRAVKWVTYHFSWKELMCLAPSDPKDAVSRTVNVQVSFAECTSFFKLCGLSSFHTLICKVDLHINLSPQNICITGQVYPVMTLNNMRTAIGEVLKSENWLKNCIKVPIY